METSVKLYSLTYRETKTYLFALLFIAGNLILPQLCHMIPGGGLMWLPIYFFTLIAAYKYGLKVGLLTAVLSPLLNSALFGMPTIAFLPVILVKSALLAVAASYAAHKFARVSMVALLIAVLGYQVVGTVFQGLYQSNFMLALQNLQVAVPGMLIQVVGGYFLLKAIARR
ncbi:MAG: ECF transporter S component [Candidatus Azobacteroides sp.]|nr:ECF transporter S component [Candidatus Azobacteroides sp.]